MPRADGTLVEFDSWTEVDGEGYTTVMRPRPGTTWRLEARARPSARGRWSRRGWWSALVAGT